MTLEQPAPDARAGATDGPAPLNPRLRRWRRSGRCESGDCVEVRADAHRIFVRDSTAPRVVLAFSHETWTHFVDAVRGGEIDPSR